MAIRVVADFLAVADVSEGPKDKLVPVRQVGGEDVEVAGSVGPGGGAAAALDADAVVAALNAGCLDLDGQPQVAADKHPVGGVVVAKRLERLPVVDDAAGDEEGRDRIAKIHFEMIKEIEKKQLV